MNPANSDKPFAALRLRPEMSRGRRYPELAHPYRTEFQRDRDRVIHARAFRRLENKTQVFPAGVSDHFRNRLTHTMEVAQIARTVAATLGVDEDLTETLALVHDIGHPPFAHAGEDELRRQMERFGETFDHNLHGLRIVESFEARYARFPGLNLTFEVREGIVKHSRDLTPGESPELDAYLPEQRPPIEAQIIDLADEVAYNTADLDDAYSAGFFTIDEVRGAVPAFSDIWEAVEMQFPGAEERVQFLETLRQVINLLVSGLLDGTANAIQAAGVATVEEVRRHPRRLVGLTESAAATGRELKRFLHRRVYNSEELLRERHRSVRMIAELFAYYEANPDRLPSLYRDQAEEGHSHRVICSYIAGMTDGYCQRIYNELLA
ncbi:MAG: deoxyguanosinetriphosphate triphosphohydrolase [Acidobacteria bacterium]|nr:deoxyguanosinetriphosphate triphosphohydrolase [Acidobacteriota bacterium]